MQLLAIDVNGATKGNIVLQLATRMPLVKQRSAASGAGLEKPIGVTVANWKNAGTVKVLVGQGQQ